MPKLLGCKTNPGLPLALLTLWLVLSGGCRTPLLTFPKGAASEPAAKAVVERAAEAQGGLEAYRAIGGVAAGFGGGWLGGVDHPGPVLGDDLFRGASRERYVLKGAGGAGGEPLPHPVVAQRHDGDGGSWWVRFQGAGTPVGVAFRGRNGEPVAPFGVAQEVTEASAVLADAQRMLLTGPFFFLERDGRPGAETAYAAAPPEEVNGVACERVLVRLRPGLGLSDEDRVLVTVGRDDGRVRRLRFSLNGLSAGEEATADVTLGAWTRRVGLLWPTRFEGRAGSPLRRGVDEQRLTALSVHAPGGGRAASGPAAAGPGELAPARWSERAAGRARPVRVMSSWLEEDWPEEVREDLPEAQREALDPRR